MNRRIFLTTLAFFAVIMLSACAGSVNYKINDVQMPKEARANILSLSVKPSDKITFIWYYTRGYQKKIKARGITEIVPVIEPMDMSSPKTLPDDTEMVGISIFVQNPNLLKYRVTGFHSTGNPEITRRWTVYEGISDSREIRVEGLRFDGKKINLGATLELFGSDGKFVVDKIDIDELTYTVIPHSDYVR